MALISSTDKLSSFLLAMAQSEIRLPLLFKNLRDHYYAMKIFLGGSNG